MPPSRQLAGRVVLVTGAAQGIGEAQARCLAERGATVTSCPAMLAAGGGSIINISSIEGVIAGYKGSTAYSASKGAVRLLTKAVAIDYVGYRIRVNSVHPGGIRSPLTEPYLEDPETRQPPTPFTDKEMGQVGSKALKF